MCAALAPVSAAAAVPSPMWQGVERVVISCRLDDAIRSPALRHSICQQILADAARGTRFPVSLAAADDLDPRSGALARQSSTLVLHVEAQPQGAPTRPAALLVSIRPERIEARAWRGSNTKQVRVPLDWNGGVARLRTPIRPLSLLLGEPGRTKGLRAPLRSDQR